MHFLFCIFLNTILEYYNMIHSIFSCKGHILGAIMLNLQNDRIK